jgi:hypothetical protein
MMSEFCYNVDTRTPGKTQAHAANQQEQPQFKPGSRMPIGRRKALSKQAQRVWVAMEDDDKTKILALHSRDLQGSPAIREVQVLRQHA